MLKKICSSILIPENNILNIYKRLKFDYKYNKFVFHSVDFVFGKDKAFIKLNVFVNPKVHHLSIEKYTTLSKKIIAPSATFQFL